MAERIKKLPSKIKEEINKKFGKNVVFSGDDEHFKLERIPTGILSLDLLLDGGLPLGRWFELYGAFSTLKTTIACFGMAQAQRLGHPVLYCDIERSITKEFLEMRGVDTSPDMLTIIQAETGEEYIEVAREYLRYGLHKVIVIDSIASMLPNREEKMSFDKEPMGAQAMMVSRMTRVLTATNKSNACLIMVNQTREKLQAFGDNTTTPGGRAPKFYSGQSVKLTRIKNTKSKGKTGERKMLEQQIVATLDKDKTSGNYGNEITMFYDVTKHRIDDSLEILHYGEMTGLINRAGNTYTYKNKKYSKANLLLAFKKKSKIRDIAKRDIINLVKEKGGIGSFREA